MRFIFYIIIVFIRRFNKNAFSLECNATHGPAGDVDCARENFYQFSFVRCVSREDALIMTDNWYYFNYPCSETILVQQKEVKRNFCKIPCMTE